MALGVTRVIGLSAGKSPPPERRRPSRHGKLIKDSQQNGEKLLKQMNLKYPNERKMNQSQQNDSKSSRQRRPEQAIYLDWKIPRRMKMRLYLNAESKNNVGYIPDWMRVSYQKDDQEYELTLDIQAWIDYDNKCLSCRCKGDLIPWALWNYATCEETDLSSLSEEELDTIFPSKKIAEIVCNSDTFEVGIYPTDNENFDLAESDVLSQCEGSFEMTVSGNKYYQKDFQFTTELNL